MSERQDFWSRRKAAVAAEARAETEAAEEAQTEEIRQAIEEKPDSEVLAELNLPDPDTMRQGDDFSAFMAKAVPERLRRRALRRLWTSNPVLANLDELLEYGEDYTDAATVIENMQTVYKLGKGMLAQFEGQPDAAQPDAGAVEVDDAQPDAGAMEAEPAGVAENEEVPGRTEEAASEAAEGSAVEMPGAVPRPRMRFVFADDAACGENA